MCERWGWMGMQSFGGIRGRGWWRTLYRAEGTPRWQMWSLQTEPAPTAGLLADLLFQPHNRQSKHTLGAWRGPISALIAITHYTAQYVIRQISWQRAEKIWDVSLLHYLYLTLTSEHKAWQPAVETYCSEAEHNVCMCMSCVCLCVCQYLFSLFKLSVRVPADRNR